MQAFEDVEKIYQERVDIYLGPLAPVDVPAKYVMDYDLLTQPLWELTYGEACGWAGLAPRGREAIERLITDEQYSLIENILRGYNPEGRIYAIEAILRIGKSVPQIILRNREIIGKLLSLDIEIAACYGCFFGYSPARWLLNDLLMEGF